ncbi:concanavalin A-like lectin/glucanase domain-containing protein [Parachaetomium inaequale]|uniref:Concanavalin A-like lectin/glucanase domain-containing protein n=1 Tax=Parachaetomium inaequale TaxID=2588326 RepID=A0AAN6SQN9_9PEZI|nr:concanavalin A-like lectin/glucanase domain-containing protein [Parachaetomium inaequale]
MRWTLTALLGSALMAHQAVAELTFTVEATRGGVPIPKSEIKLEPFEFGRTRMGHATPPPQVHRKTRRTNPTANSANWCGSVNTVPSTNQIKVIHGTFQHPTCTKRAGVTTYPQAAANWVGIDGDSWTSALLQAGTVCKIDNSTGIVKNEAWWQWVPSAAYTITSMPVAPDDWFEITIDTSSTTAGEITLSNLSQGQTYTININSGPTLARVNGDWVVERPYYGSTLAGFPTFTDVWFDDMWATTQAGSLSVVGAKQYQIQGLCASQECWGRRWLVGRTQ